MDANGVPKVVANGPYEKTKAGAATVCDKLKAGESVWIVVSGYPPKIIKGPKASAIKTKESK